MPVWIESQVCITSFFFQWCPGGFSGEDRLRTVEKLDVKVNHWSAVPSMKYSRSNFTVAVIEDMILAIGGYSQRMTIDSVEAFDVNTERWLVYIFTCNRQEQRDTKISACCYLPSKWNFQFNPNPLYYVCTVIFLFVLPPFPSNR
jgi:hypothetical protein